MRYHARVVKATSAIIVPNVIGKSIQCSFNMANIHSLLPIASHAVVLCLQIYLIG